MRTFTSCLCALLVLSLGCEGGSGDSEDGETGEPAIPACVEYAVDGCGPLYPATYDQVWTQTFTNGCAEFGTACHAQADAAGALNGLVFADPQAAHDHLLMGGDDALVIPGDPLCSPLFVRLATDDASIRMPPGSSGLADGALCSIAAWISDGATYQQP